MQIKLFTVKFILSVVKELKLPCAYGEFVIDGGWGGRLDEEFY